MYVCVFVHVHGEVFDTIFWLKIESCVVWWYNRYGLPNLGALTNKIAHFHEQTHKSIEHTTTQQQEPFRFAQNENKRVLY